MADELRGLIARALDASEAERFARFQLEDFGVLTEVARSLLSLVEPMTGACLLLSASWALYLREKHSIPAVAVAGDLKVSDQWIFRGTDALPSTGRNGHIVRGKWKGHCWIEVADFIGDLSLFRTAYALPTSSALRAWVDRTVGGRRGAFLCRRQDVPSELRFRRRFVLTDAQMKSLVAGQDYINEHGSQVTRD